MPDAQLSYVGMMISGGIMIGSLSGVIGSSSGIPSMLEGGWKMVDGG